MRALWLEQHTLSLREDLPRPEPATGEALVRVRMAGICATDLHLSRGYYPFTGILGHEFVGDIVTPTEQAGKRVVGSINLGCGVCHECQRGLPNHCVQRRVLGIKDYPGAFAEYLTLPIANLHCVPDKVPDEQAVFTEPLAAALEILQQISIQPTQRVLVIGAGRLGQLIAQVLHLSTCDLWVCARYAQQQATLKRFGIHWLTESEITPRDWDIVIEATGAVNGLNLALEAIRPRGCIVLKSTFAGQVEIPLSRLVVDEIRLQGSRCGAFAPALRALEQGLVHPECLLSRSLSLSQGVEAMHFAAQKDAGKVVLQMDVA